MLPGLPDFVPNLLHLNFWAGAVTTPTPNNPLGLPLEVLQALAFFTRKPGAKIVAISPLVKTQFKIWAIPGDIPGLTVPHLTQFGAIFGVGTRETFAQRGKFGLGLGKGDSHLQLTH